MSKILKIHAIPKSLNAMGSVENQSETFCEDWLKIDAFKDWLEPVAEDQCKAWCSACNVTLYCSRNELSKHAASSGHQTALQISRKRKLVIGQLIGSMASSSGGSGQPRKIILLRRNLKPSMQCEVVREAVGEDSEGDVSPNMISSASSMKNIVHLNEMQLAQQRRRKSFRSEWLDVPEFKDWLSPEPGNRYKAHCIACDTVLNAGKSELEKHAAGAKHEKAVEAMKQMALEQQAWDEANEIDEEDDNDDEYDSRVSMGTQTMVIGEGVLMNQHEEQKQQLEVMNSIASSVESLAAATAGALEILSRNQETLNNILMHLVNK